MYLKALEIQGFKSFPDKVRLSFEKQVTCIVGPNGSGKSNISDAILWVTGEQSSKALRGGKMEDVIFGGTQKRSQMGFAEVSLILDNTDGTLGLESSEVMITRRYYRSGESEYYINRRVVRLRDITELLMDTGMGQDGYSIIGQGRIDEILSAKSTDRREIFEEAAGISRFRHRKEESERKLQRTDENLVRVNDKIAELELQVEPLRKQAEIAKKYLILRDELRGVEVSVWADTLEKLAINSEKLNESQTAAELQLNEVRNEVDALYNQNEELSKKMRSIDIEAENVREKLSSTEGQCAENDSTLAVLKANLESNISETNRVNFELSQQENRDVRISEQIDEKYARINEINSEKQVISEKIENILNRSNEITISAGRTADEMSELLREQNEAISAASDGKARLSALSSAVQEMSDRNKTLLKEKSISVEKLSHIKTDADKCYVELQEAQKKVQSLSNMIKGYSMRVDTRRKKAEEYRDKTLNLSMEITALRSRINILREMEKEYQGYSKSSKTVMQEAERGILKNVYGTVGNLIKAKSKYAVAIETALGSSIQNIIVESPSDGKAGIELLKRREAGRATFMPLSTIKGRQLNERGLSNENGFEGAAIDLAEYDTKFTEIYSYLIGRIVIVDNLDNAIKIGNKYNHRFTLVTLDGQVVNAGGSMTGGSRGKNAGILSRVNELEELSFKVSELDENLKKLQSSLASSEAELSDAQHELEVSSAELRTAESNVLRLSSDERHFELLIKTAEDSDLSLDNEMHSLKERLCHYQDEIETTSKEISDFESKSADLQLRIDGLSAGREEMLNARDEIISALSKLREENASLEAEISAAKNAINELTSIREGLSGDRAQQMEYISSLKIKNESIKNEITEFELKNTDFTASIEKFRSDLSDISEKRMKIESERIKFGREMQDKNNLLLNLEREFAGFEQKKLAVSMEEKQIVDKLWDSYELTRTDALNQKNDISDIHAAKQRIGELRRDISKLGNPNIGAIDEFERVNARYTYLTEQRDDITKAKNDLCDIITDITDEMQAIFIREFARINENFQTTFLELFGGGKASLELEDENDVLNCGIEIKVQPPGKSLKTITLLSGGEKAFVAISIYFAVLKIRPAPFIVMDEIESALDEANVLRFAEYMRKMSDKTQMLVISHRRGTMEEADVLYGVTMQEQGVSRIINIDVEEAERTILK